jgi:hypothetical protein
MYLLYISILKHITKKQKKAKAPASTFAFFYYHTVLFTGQVVLFIIEHQIFIILFG